MLIGMPARMSVEKDPLLPILEITLASPSQIKEILIKTIIYCIEIAAHFDGTVLDKESNPKLRQGEVVGVTTKIMFSSKKNMLEFATRIRPPQ